MAQDAAGQDDSAEGNATRTTTAEGKATRTTTAEGKAAQGVGDKCKGFGTMADVSLAAPDGELTEEAAAKNAGDKDFSSARQAMAAQNNLCAISSACPAATFCVKAGSDCETDSLPFLKSNKCDASILAKVTRAFKRATAANVKKYEAKAATAKAAATTAKAKKEAADAAVAKCGETCAADVKAAAATANDVYVAAQRKETKTAEELSNQVASAANADAAAAKAVTKADDVTETDSGAASVAVGAATAAVAGVVFAQLF